MAAAQMMDPSRMEYPSTVRVPSRFRLGLPFEVVVCIERNTENTIVHIFYHTEGSFRDVFFMDLEFMRRL